MQVNGSGCAWDSATEVGSQELSPRTERFPSLLSDSAGTAQYMYLIGGLGHEFYFSI